MKILTTGVCIRVMDLQKLQQLDWDKTSIFISGRVTSLSVSSKYSALKMITAGPPFSERLQVGLNERPEIPPIRDAGG